MNYKECKYLVLKNKWNRYDMNIFFINFINFVENIVIVIFYVNKILVIFVFNVNYYFRI